MPLGLTLAEISLIHLLPRDGAAGESLPNLVATFGKRAAEGAKATSDAKRTGRGGKRDVTANNAWHWPLWFFFSGGVGGAAGRHCHMKRKPPQQLLMPDNMFDPTCQPQKTRQINL